jgi:hypothetical protein
MKTMSTLDRMAQSIFTYRSAGKDNRHVVHSLAIPTSLIIIVFMLQGTEISLDLLICEIVGFVLVAIASDRPRAETINLV